MSDVIRAAYRRTWWALVLRGLLGLAIGVLIFWKPLDSVAALALVIAWWALFGGTVQVVHSFALRPVFPHWWVLLLSGIVGIVFGVAALRNYPGLSLAFAVIWVSWWLLITGVLAISAALLERRTGVSWGWTLAFGLVAIVAGVFALMSPGATLASIMGLIALFALVSGIVHLMGAFSLSRAKDNVVDQVTRAAV
jgi:uncharacterized membrane protein HdeD (DUF308 family)